jgi:putative methyltransferase (TIGR04325 family)
VALRRWIPPAVFDAMGSALPDRLQRFEVMASWDEAARCCIGYEQSTLKDRGSGTGPGTTSASNGLKNHRTSRDLQFIAAVGTCLGAFRPGSPVRVLDFGGAFGHYFDVAAGAFPNKSWDWTVVETPTMATLAAGTRGGDRSISWTSDLDSALGQHWDLVFASASLNYVPFPMRVLTQLGRMAPYVLITRLPLWPVDQHLPVVQRLSRKARFGAYPAWVFSEAAFLEDVDAIGEVVLRFDVPEDTAWIAGHRGTYTGLLIRTGAAS